MKRTTGIVLAFAAAIGFAAPALAQATHSPPAAQAAAASYTDAQLNAFIAASLEVQPLTERLPGQTSAQQAQTSAEISAALQRHAITSTTYNEIARRAQTDETLTARINMLREAHSAQDSNHAAPPASPQ